MSWEPIETAPRDGTCVLLFAEIPDIVENGVVMLGFSTPQIVSGYWDAMDDSWCTTVSTFHGPFVTATHWQPLPNPPEDV